MYVLVSAVVLLLCAASAFPHAKLEASEPKPGEMLAVPPSRVKLLFSVAVQPSMSSITVVDEAGRRFDRGAATGSDENKVLSVDLEALGPGEYRVDWRALSADDHMIKGDFRFQVHGSAAKAEPSSELATAEVDHSNMDHSMHETPPGINWPQSLIRWLMYLSMLTLAGAFAFRLFVAGKAVQDLSAVTSQENAAAALAGLDRRLLAVALAANLGLIAAAFAALVFQSSAIFETGVIESVSPTQLRRVIGETSFGTPWALQMLCAVAALIFTILLRAGRRGLWMWLGLLSSAIILLAPSLTGHARAAYADYSFAIVSDWFHLAAAAVWIGGLVQIAVSVPALLKVLEGNTRVLAISAIIAYFNKVALTAVALIVITGAYNSWIHVESFSALFSSAYGNVLLAKVGVSVVMVVLGGINAFVLHPKIKAWTAEADGEASPVEAARLQQSVRIEMVLAATVLLLAAILAFLPPAREHSAQQASAHISGKMRKHHAPS